MSKAKFKVGQVVMTRCRAESGKGRVDVRYARVIYSRFDPSISAFFYGVWPPTASNAQVVHQDWLRKLTKRERGA